MMTSLTMMLMTMVIVLMMIALRARLDEQGIDLDQGKNANQKNTSSGGRPAKSGIPSQTTRRASRLAGGTGEQV